MVLGLLASQRRGTERDLSEEGRQGKTRPLGLRRGKRYRERAVAVALYGQSIQYPPSHVLVLTFLYSPQRLYGQSI